MAKGNFPMAVRLVLEKEGVLSDHPSDKGGLTKYGITKKSYPNLDIVNLTKDHAIAIYKKDFWDYCRCEELPYPVDVLVFDYAVNSGQDRACRDLQRSCNSMGEELVVDGKIGPKTLSAVEYIEGYDFGLMCLSREYLLRRVRLYTRLIGDKSQRVFIYGWLRKRVINLAVDVGIFEQGLKI